MDVPDMQAGERDVTALIGALPLPLALVRRDGQLMATSRTFDEDFGAAALTAADLRTLLDDDPPHWASLAIADRTGSRQMASVYVVPLRDDRLVVFARPGSGLDATLKVAELEQRVHELERLVATDTLTGTWNRAHLGRIMAMEMSRSARHRQPLSVILLDIDHFKRVNDTHGHAAGDAVLRKLVHAVQAQTRPGDMLFRWGGEEFLVLVPSTTYRQARSLAEKLRTSVAALEFPVVGSITISLGVAERLSGESSDALFERVDKALYAAKTGGRNATVVDARGCSDAWEASVLRLAWSEDYACGHEIIDAQHRRLFALANRLIDASLREASGQRELTDALGVLVGEVASHFTAEEAILESMNYIRLAQHRRAHAALLKRAGHMRALADSGMLSFGMLVDFLVHDVVAKHLLTMDRQYFPLFRVVDTS